MRFFHIHNLNGNIITQTLFIPIDLASSLLDETVFIADSSYKLASTVNTTLSGILIGSPTTINAGDRISIDLGGTLTNLFCCCTLGLKSV